MVKRKKTKKKQTKIPVQEVEVYLSPEKFQKYCKEELNLKYSLRTFEQWRSDAKGPRYMKPGKNVIYPMKEIKKWADTLMVLK